MGERYSSNLAIPVSTEVIRRLDELKAPIEAANGSAFRVARTGVARLALLRGLQILEDEYNAPQNTPSARIVEPQEDGRT